MPTSLGLFINHKWHTGKGETFESFNPATNELIWRGTAASKEDLDAAVKAAKKAQPGWAAQPLGERVKVLRAFADELKNHLPQLAETISKEVGKPLWEAKTEVQAMVQKVSISEEAQQERCGVSRAEHPLGLSITRHRPHGVVAVFGPYNFPGHLPNGHIIPALLAGNSVIFKPSELTPLVAEVTMRCWEKVLLPHGVLSMLQGGRETGQLIANHPGINGLFFTGSFSTGVKLSESCVNDPSKILALEMGGNNPLVVSDPADLRAAAYMIIQSAYLTSGQRCTCARRLIVLDKIADDLLEELMEMITTLKIGPYTDNPEPFMGPVISSSMAEKLLQAQRDLVGLGGRPLIEMRLLEHSTSLLSPGLMDVTGVNGIPDEEIFGPLLQVVRVKTLDEALRQANKTTYGLAAGILTDSLAEYALFRNTIKAGIINWNVPLTGASSAAPFGGIGRSGNHRPSAYYAADYCSYPVASIENPLLKMPAQRPPGLS